MRKFQFEAAVFSVAISLLAVFESSAWGDAGECTQYRKDLPIENTLASASMFANLRNKPGSVRFESNTIFEKAKNQAENMAPPANFCPKGCAIAKRPVMFFRSTPNKILTGYSEAAHCSALRKSSSLEPFQYQTTALRTVEDLETWIGDLSQGDGKDGKDLYKKCDGTCSPRYEYTVVRTQDTPRSYLVNAAVICGEARDKDDNQYALESFFRWTCESPT